MLTRQTPGRRIRMIATVVFCTFFVGTYALADTPTGAADPAPESAPASVKVINFTAEWCPNCRILDPRMDEAMLRFDGKVAMVNVDHTAMRGATEREKYNLAENLKGQLMNEGVRYLWDWYGGITGIAVIVAADNGEPLTCVNRALSVDQIAARMNESVILAEQAPPGGRRPEGPDCPAPMNM